MMGLPLVVVVEGTRGVNTSDALAERLRNRETWGGLLDEYRGRNQGMESIATSLDLKSILNSLWRLLMLHIDPSSKSAFKSALVIDRLIRLLQMNSKR